MTEWMRASPARKPWLDVVLAIFLFAATVGYLAALPLRLGSTDEGHQLHAAKRVFEGEVIYRDIFDLSTPGWTFLMAGSFGVFGATLATARFTTVLGGRGDPYPEGHAALSDRIVDGDATFR